MKLKTIALWAITLNLVCNIGFVEAIGGGRGGGGGGGGREGAGGRGGGGGRETGAVRSGGGNRGGGQRFNGTPTMSRAEYRKNTNTARSSFETRPAKKPAAPVSRPIEQKRPAKENQRITRDEAKKYLQNSQSKKFDKETLKQKQKEYQSNRGERQKNRKRDAEKVREKVKYHWNDYHHWFSKDFYDRHHYHPYYWNSRANWWRAPSWVSLTGWLAGWGWTQPIYYQSGVYPIYVTSDNGSYDGGYDGGASIPPEPISSGEADQGDWLPLGVFAVGKTEDLAAASNMFVQLALNRDGEIAGTYYNASTDQTYEIDGIVDQQTQEAAWKLAENPNSPIVSTGLYNLTQDSTDVQVEFPDGTQQTWVYVRME